jgi:pSer/pThr/pTyr-binding forkhead associated (FHA) protein
MGRFVRRQEARDRPLEGLACMYLLEVLSGPLDGKTWQFEREITIGRDDAMAEACIALDRYVSRKHARLRIDKGAVLLTDLESRNGTKLNGRPVVGDAPLTIGVPFVVGRTVLRVTHS